MRGGMIVDVVFSFGGGVGVIGEILGGGRALGWRVGLGMRGSGRWDGEMRWVFVVELNAGWDIWEDREGGG